MNFKDETGFGKWLRSERFEYNIEGYSDYYTTYGTTSICYYLDNKNIRIGLISDNGGSRLGIIYPIITDTDAPRPLKYTYLPEPKDYKHYLDVLSGNEKPNWN
jgi:hypothetical protein